MRMPVWHGAVTIATNMAGRGTDIKLGRWQFREAWRTKVSSVLSVMSPDVSTTSCVDVPDVREIRDESKFYISLEDDSDAPVRFPERLMNVFNALGMPEG